MSEYDPTTERMAHTLGLVSLGLGVSMTFAPRVVTKLAGVDDSALARLMTRLVGVRELGHAAGLLAGRPEWVWTRVGGDAMDLPALLIAMSNRHGTRRLRAMIATATVAGITAADVYTAWRTLQERRTGESAGVTAENVYTAMRRVQDRTTAAAGPKHVQAAVTVNRSPAEVYQFWHDFSNLPRFMFHVESVETAGDGRLHWRAEEPLQHTMMEWDAQIVEDRPNELIAWRAENATKGPRMGAVHFDTAPGGRGTEVRLEMEYPNSPIGKVGMAVAKLVGEAPDQQARDDLRRFKQLIEIGEIVRSEGSPEGTHTRQLLRQRPAQPLPT
jgi:uncharacterized membrane protein